MSARQPVSDPTLGGSIVSNREKTVQITYRKRNNWGTKRELLEGEKRGQDLIDWQHRRYHNSQAAADIQTAAKTLARRAGLDHVLCPCGERIPVAR
jgi:hypothetical protein